MSAIHPARRGEEDQRHRSANVFGFVELPRGWRSADYPTAGPSPTTVTFAFARDELPALLVTFVPSFSMPVPSGSPGDAKGEGPRFENACNCTGRHSIRAVFGSSGALASASLLAWDGAVAENVTVASLAFTVSNADRRVRFDSSATASRSAMMPFQLAGIMRTRVVSFRAERLNVGEATSREADASDRPAHPGGCHFQAGDRAVHAVDIEEGASLITRLSIAGLSNRPRVEASGMVPGPRMLSAIRSTNMRSTR